MPEDNRERLKELWEDYKAYYLQSQEGTSSAFPYVLEHAIKEIRLLDSIEPDVDFTQADIDGSRNNAVDIIETIIAEGRVPINNISSQVKCDQCIKFAKGVIQTVNLPCGELYEHKRVCYMCAGGVDD